MNWNSMADAAAKIQAGSIAKTQEYIRFRQATGLQFRIACWGSVSSIMVEDHPDYLSVRNLTREMAQNGIPIVAGGSYLEKGRGVGIQHAAHQGAFEINPALSIGIDLHIPEWGTGGKGRIYRQESFARETHATDPVGYYIQAETLEDRMIFMEILAQVFIAFPIFGFGTDFERARMGQMLYYLKTLKEEIPESIFPGTRAFREFGVQPRAVLVGPYDYCRALVDTIAQTDATRAWVNGGDEGVFVFCNDNADVKRFIFKERKRWRTMITEAGGIPEN